jgi:type IV secretory pathway VirB3-like protein
VPAHVLAATLGLGAELLLGRGYAAAALALVATIVALVVLDLVHPPAIATSLIFALQAGTQSDLALFGLALTIVASLIVLRRAAVWLLARLDPPH